MAAVRAPLVLSLLVRYATAVSVLLMAGWNAYICLRLRPDLPSVVINLTFWVVPIAALLALSGRVWPSVALGTAVTFVLQRVHWLKWKYLEQTWMAADLRLALDPDNWLLVRRYPDLSSYVAVGTVTLVLAWVVAPKRPRVSASVRAFSAALVVALVVASAASRNAHVFDPYGFNLYGHFANLVYSVSALDYRPPGVTGNSQTFTRAADGVDLVSSGQVEAGARPDIVVWLQESAMDLADIDIPAAALPTQRMYKADRHTVAGGALRVHTWGGSTWLSEFAVLTGLSHQDFGPSGHGVFYSVTSRVRESLPRLLKRYGYRTAVLTSGPKGQYNGEQAYRDLGFDSVITPLDFPSRGGKSLVTHPPSDDELGRYVMELLAADSPEPVFLFVLSIMQHGPYDATHPVAYGLERSGLSSADQGRLSDYATRMVATDVACLALSEQLLARPRATVFAYFGDHQPNVGRPLPYREGLPNPHYVTAYGIKANFRPAVAVVHRAPLDISFLGGAILDVAGVPLGPVFSATRAMRTLCGGRLTDCGDAELANSYRAHLYRDLEAAPITPELQ